MNNKTYEKFMNLKLTNYWLFPRVFGDSNNIALSKEMIQRCIGREIEEISLIIPECNEDGGYLTHGVRYDVKFKGDNKFYIVEMQNYHDSLIKRSNYEAAVTMVNAFDPGSGYDKLQDILVIYICTFDYFGFGKARYVIEQKLQGFPELQLDSNITTIILNTTARSEEKELDALMKYLNDANAEDSFTEKLENTIQAIKQNQITRGDFMTLEEVIRYERKIESEEQKKADRIEFCKKMLSNNIPIDVIINCTGLSELEIQEIQKQN